MLKPKPNTEVAKIEEEEPGIRTAIALAVPGGGKGTLSVHLTNLWGGDHGALDVISMSTILGKICRSDGTLVPDDEVVELFRREFHRHRQRKPSLLEKLLRRQPPQRHPFVFIDGFPRTPAQANALMNIMDSHEMLVSSVFRWLVSDDVAVERQMNRWKLQLDYPERRRPDFLEDRQAAIEQAYRRIQIYKNHEERILDIFTCCGIDVLEIDGDMDQEIVFRQFIDITGWPVSESAFQNRFGSHFASLPESALT